VGVYSDYIERGLTYSRERYSLQGHLEYDSAAGWYTGAFLVHNSVILNKETIELDPYGGYLRRIGAWTIDAAVFSWLYPHSRLDVSGNRYNTAEATLDVTRGVFGIKLWYDLRNYWGLDGSSAAPDYNLHPNGSSQGSLYVDSHLSLPLPLSLQLKLHVGRQYIHHYAQLDYTDWMIGLERPFGQRLTLGAAYSDTNANAALWADPRGLNLGRAKWLAYIRWSFT